MFTGIIRRQVKVKNIKAQGGYLSLALDIPRARLKGGNSVAVNGICLTIVSVGKGVYWFKIMPETLRCTTLRRLKKGDKVNIELPLRYGQPYGGHFVLGHIDSIGKIKFIEKGHGGTMAKIEFPPRFRRLVRAKGSVVVDGVSLTVVKVGPRWLTVALIPYTLVHTTLGTLARGDFVNLEFDILARYLYAATSKKN